MPQAATDRDTGEQASGGELASTTALPALPAMAEVRHVMAVVVSFRPGERILATVAALQGQVGCILVVDNGSDEASLQLLRGLAADGRIQLHEQGANLGLGAALNHGARRALDQGYAWLLTMDQDSTAAPDMVQSLLELAQRNQVQCVSPNLVVHGHPPSELKSGPVAYAITSGNLLRLEVWQAAGPYNEGYFIDCIDFDFSLRVRRCGFAIHKAPRALLHHELGHKVAVRRRFERFYTQHGPVRRYYMFRNFLFLARSHLLHEPAFIGKLLLSHLILLALMLRYEPMLRPNLGAIADGVLDFLRGRQGPYKGA